MSQTPSSIPGPSRSAPPTLPVASGRRLDPRLPSLSATQSFEADQYRTLRHTIEQARAERDVRVIGVTSPVAGDGKTLTAVNLAGALAHAPGSRVLLIDADLRRPSIGNVLGAFHAEGPGLVEALTQTTVPLDTHVRRLDRFRLSVLAARRTNVDAYELLSSPRLGAVVAEARRIYEYVIIDTPPILPVPDPRLLAPWVDAFLLVVRAGKTPRKLLGAALSQLDPRKVLGLVFNGSDVHSQRYGKYYYSYATQK